MTIEKLLEIGKNCEVFGRHPDGQPYTHGEGTIEKAWSEGEAAKKRNLIGFTFRDQTGCAWIFPGAERWEEEDDQVVGYYMSALWKCEGSVSIRRVAS